MIENNSSKMICKNDKSTLKLALLLSLASAIAGCEQHSSPHTTSPEPELQQIQEAAAPAQSIHLPFLNAAKQSFEKTLGSATRLHHAIAEFTQQPTPETLLTASTALKQTHDDYLATQIFRDINLLHPVLDISQNEPKVIHPVAVRIDQYPIIPGYLDAVAGYPISGLIYSELPITAETLNTEHQFSDSAYVAIGFHALEFILAGDPTIEQESSSRFTSLSGDSPDKSPEHRRSLYIQVLADMLLEDLRLLQVEWTSEQGFYSQTLSSLNQPQRDQLIINALIAEKTSLAVLRTEITTSGETSSHHSNNSIEARTLLLRTVVQAIAESGYALPENLQTVTMQEAPERTKP